MAEAGLPLDVAMFQLCALGLRHGTLQWSPWGECTQAQAARFGNEPGYQVRVLYAAARDAALPGIPTGFTVAPHGAHGITVGSPAGDVVTAAPKGPHHSRVLHALVSALLAAASPIEAAQC